MVDNDRHSVRYSDIHSGVCRITVDIVVNIKVTIATYLREVIVIATFIQ